MPETPALLDELAIAAFRRAQHCRLRYVEERRLGSRLWFRLTSLVTLLLEFPRMYVVVIRPDTASMTLSIFKRLEVAFIGAIAIKHPGPSIEDHFQLDVAVRWSSQPTNELPEPGSWTAGINALIHLQVGHGYDPLVSINNAASVHLH